MTRAEIERALYDIATQELEIEPTAIDERIPILDSLERMHLAMAVEDRFRIRLSPADEAELGSMADVVALVDEKLRATPTDSATRQSRPSHH